MYNRNDPSIRQQFVVGRTYSTRSACDHECIFSFTILARTAKTVTVEVNNKTVKRGLSVWEGCEQFRPFGTYSMCPIVGADDKDLRVGRNVERPTPRGLYPIDWA